MVRTAVKWLAACVLTAACSVLPAPREAGSVILAGMEENSRALFGEKGEWGWETLFSADEVLCAGGQNSVSVSLSDSGKRAAFTFDGIVGQPFYGLLNPGIVRSVEGSRFFLTLPGVQNFTEGSFDRRGTVIYGQGNANELPLHHACAFLRLTPTGDGAPIKEVIVSAEDGAFLCGDLCLDAQDGSFAGTGARELVLDCAGGVERGTPLTLSLPAGRYTGLCIRLTDTENHYMELRKADFTAEAGKMYAKSFEFTVQGTVVDASAGTAWYNAANFEDRSLSFQSQTLSPVLSDNPRKDRINTSERCLCVTTAGGKTDNVYANFARSLDFTANEAVLRIKVLSPRKGATLRLSIKRKQSGQSAECPTLNLDRSMQTEGAWEVLTFDFRDFAPGSNLYERIVLYPDYQGGHGGEDWYFDDIEVPDDDLSALDLFRRISDQPFLSADASSPAWRRNSITAGRIVRPEQSPDGRWYWYVRGSSSAHQTIGLFTQEAADFNPLGPWDEYPGNPVVNVGTGDAFDAWRILGVCPVPMPDHSLYLYYKARPYNQGSTFGTGLAQSTDGVHFTKLVSASICPRNPSDVLYHADKFLYYSGIRLYTLDDPAQVPETLFETILSTGDGPAHFDRICLQGDRIFRLEGVDKWFMAYYGDASHTDFPHRFHVALSDDLVHWTKVDNPQPLFTRGPRGRWDQGGIWAPEIIEYQGKLYMYYEGWGREGYVPDRDEEYFTPACSQTGVAVCDKQAFLNWCGL